MNADRVKAARSVIQNMELSLGDIGTAAHILAQREEVQQSEELGYLINQIIGHYSDSQAAWEKLFDLVIRNKGPILVNDAEGGAA